MLIKNRSLLFAFIVQQLLLLTNVISISIPGEFVGSQQEADEASSRPDANDDAYYLYYDRNGTITEIRNHTRYAKERISNGISALPGQFPSFVHLDLSKNRMAMWRTNCGGTILDDRHILTAAHCTDENLYATVIVNPFNRHRHYTMYRSEKICTSKKFKLIKFPHFYMEYDVAIIKLERPIQFNAFVKPACMPTVDLPIGKEAVAVGLGRNWEARFNHLQGTNPDVPQILFISRVNCGYQLLPHQNDYCARYHRPNQVGSICSGDSGGPIYTWDSKCQTVHGIASSSQIGCEKGFGSISVFGSVYRLHNEIELLKNECR